MIAEFGFTFADMKKTHSKNYYKSIAKSITVLFILSIANEGAIVFFTQSIATAIAIVNNPE